MSYSSPYYLLELRRLLFFPEPILEPEPQSCSTKRAISEADYYGAGTSSGASTSAGIISKCGIGTSVLNSIFRYVPIITEFVLSHLVGVLDRLFYDNHYFFKYSIHMVGKLQKVHITLSAARWTTPSKWSLHFGDWNMLRTIVIVILHRVDKLN